MAKGPLVTDGVRILIASVQNKHPRWKARQILDETRLLLRKHNPELSPDWPSLSTVQKELAAINRKNKGETENPLDLPWSIATLAEYEMPPDTLPAILKVQELIEGRARERAVGDNDRSWRLTIRQARWTSRLCYMFSDDDIATLAFAARMYARMERIRETLGISLDSLGFDAPILGPDSPCSVRSTEPVEQILQVLTEGEPACQRKPLRNEGGTQQ